MNCPDARPLLPAYVDGELDLVHSLDIETHLRTCPVCSQDYHNQQALHAALSNGNLYYRPPAGLEARVQRAVRQAGRAPVRTRPPLWSWVGLAAALACVILGWGLSQALARPAADDPLAAAVLAGHVRSLMPGHLTDVLSSDQHTVKPWFDGRLDFAPPVVDLAAAGFPLVGGRLDYLDNRPVAALVYGRQKHFINVFLWPAAAPGSTPPATTTRQGYNLIQWRGAGMTYWAVSDLNVPELQEFVRLLQDPVAPTASP